MLRQHIVEYEGKWWNFFLDRTGALCFRVRKQYKWDSYEILLKNIAGDFTVLAQGGQIHIVCQDLKGSIYYLQYGEEQWQKTTVYESGGEEGYQKFFHLTSVAGYLNLFYVLKYKQRPMLVHQILGMGGNNVVDNITLSENPFCVVEQVGTSLAVFYVNGEGTPGFRKFLWSKKAFQSFVPLTVENGEAISCMFALAGESGQFRLCGIKRVENIDNLFFAFAGENGAVSKLSTVYLDTDGKGVPVLLDDGEKLYMIWPEGNQVMYTVSGDNGHSWSKPVRFIKGEYLPPILVRLSTSKFRLACYGYEADRAINLFVLSSLLTKDPAAVKQTKKEFEPEGRDVEKFAQESVRFNRYKLNEEPQEKNYVTVDALYSEINQLKASMTDLTKMMPVLRSGLDAVGGVESIIRSQAEHLSQLEQRIYNLENYFIARNQPQHPEEDAAVAENE